MFRQPKESGTSPIDSSYAQKTAWRATGLLLGYYLSLPCGPTPGLAGESDPTAITSIAKTPDLPQPFVLRDWKQVAREFDGIVFDESRQGPHVPLIWLETRRTVNDVDGFSISDVCGKLAAEP